jgi:hypothetical protein
MVARLLGISLQRQIKGVVRPGLATGALFACSSALGTVVHTESWFALFLLAALSAGAIAILALFAGLSIGPRQRVWNRALKVVRLT